MNFRLKNEVESFSLIQSHQRHSAREQCRTISESDIIPNFNVSSILHPPAQGGRFTRTHGAGVSFVAASSISLACFSFRVVAAFFFKKKNEIVTHTNTMSNTISIFRMKTTEFIYWHWQSISSSKLISNRIFSFISKFFFVWLLGQPSISHRDSPDFHANRTRRRPTFPSNNSPYFFFSDVNKEQPTPSRTDVGIKLMTASWVTPF